MCVLRIAAPDLPAMVASMSMTPYRLDKDTAHFTVSDADCADLPRQAQDAIAFLTVHRSAIGQLMALRNASGELDFATDYEPGTFTSRTIPAAVIRLAGELGLDLTVSGYPNAGYGHAQA